MARLTDPVFGSVWKQVSGDEQQRVLNHMIGYSRASRGGVGYILRIPHPAGHECLLRVEREFPLTVAYVSVDDEQLPDSRVSRLNREELRRHWDLDAGRRVW